MRIAIGAKSDIGRVRQGNEDSYLVQDPLFAVADGMGGHLAGDVASQTAIDTITHAASVNPPRETTALESLIEQANSAIWSKAQDEPALHGMGTTCTLILVDGSQIHIGHVGDSRAYLFREGELSQLTEDHTLVGRMVQEGRLTTEEAERHPQRSIITRALGVDSEVQVDTSSIPVQEGDRILICSDGLTSMIGTSDIHRVLTEEADPQAAVETLVSLANEAGGEDNITAVVIAFEAGEGPASIAAAAHDDRTDTVARVDTAPKTEREDFTQAIRVPPRDHGAPARPVGDVTPTGRRVPRVILSIVLIVAVLTIGAAALFKYMIVDNSYFVGVNEEGSVAIYQGLPEEVVGLTFKEEQETADVALEDLPDFLRADVEEGIKADSLEDAQQTVSNLEDRARDREFEKTRDRDRKSNNT